MRHPPAPFEARHNGERTLIVDANGEKVARLRISDTVDNPNAKSAALALLLSAPNTLAILRALLKSSHARDVAFARLYETKLAFEQAQATFKATNDRHVQVLNAASEFEKLLPRPPEKKET